MNRLRAASAVAAAALIAVLVAASAQAAHKPKAPHKPVPKPNVIASKPKAVAFSASYSGAATVKVADNVADILANGSGSAALLGAGKITGHGTGNTAGNPACVPFTGPGTIIGAKGTLAFNVLTGSSGCGDEQGQMFSISGKAAVTKGTGALAKAKGTLKITGVYDRGAGTFTVKFKGSLTK